MSPGEPIWLDFSDEVKAKFTISRDAQGIITLKTTVFENGEQTFEERITEKVHEPQIICELLGRTGFQNVTCSDRLPENAENHGTTWFVVAQKLG